MCVGACVCEWMGERARAWGRGSPRSPAERGAGGGGQAAPSKPLAAGPAPRQAFSSPLPGGSPATLVHRTGSTGLPRRASAAVASQEEEEEGRGAPHANLGTCSQSTRRCSPRESRKGLELRRARESPVRSRPPGGGPRQTPQSLGGGAERGHRLPERTAAVRSG